MTRRHFLGAAGAFSLAAQARKPNIIVILADDLGYSDLGAYGGKDASTPHIDSLARNGVRFTNAYVSGPYCSPTRAGLMTGRYQQRFGHEFNAHTSKPFFDAGGTTENLGLPTSETTIAGRMRDAGYATGAIGKWHLGAPPKFHPNKRGFDEYVGFLGGAREYFPAGKGGVGPIEIERNGSPVKWDGYLTDLFGNEAAGFIDRHQKHPFYLYVAFNAVHTPMQAEDERLKKHAHIADTRRRTYVAMLESMDDAVGTILAKVKETGLEQDTLIFFLSDNGGPTNKYAVNGSINRPLRGSKGDTWEGGIRVPMLAQWKGRLSAGTAYHKPVIQLDISATAASLGTGRINREWKLDGVDLIPYLTGKQRNDPHRALYWRFGELMAVRMGDWKVVRTWDNKQPELYNLAKDIGEENNLASSEPARLERMMKEWRAWDNTLVAPAWPRPEITPPAVQK
ncbi:MAG: sulfatase [Acidobacteria bacterium]|nr:sulfatase [Acidobacteriota bacterium]